MDLEISLSAKINQKYTSKCHLTHQNNFKDISSASILLFFFREKKAFFSLFMAIYLSGRVVLAFLKQLPKGLLGVGIFHARCGPISVKNSLNFLAISSSKVIHFLSLICLRASFDLLC